MKKANKLPKSDTDLRYLAMTHLSIKYSKLLHFYSQKIIDQAIYNDLQSSANVHIKDLFMLCEDQENLNRMYNYYNKLGEEQIYERIRMIGRFYEKNITLSEYPLMIVTNTRKIFQTRQRKLKKMIGSNSSSDESEGTQVKEYSFESSGFLQSMSKPSSSFSVEIAKMKQNKKNELSFDEETHTIYQESPHIQQKAFIRIKNNELQKSVCNLICDFGDIDVEKTIADYERIMRLKKENQRIQQANNKQLMKKVQKNVNQQKNKKMYTQNDYANKYYKQNKQQFLQNYRRKNKVTHKKKLSLLSCESNYEQYKKERQLTSKDKVKYYKSNIGEKFNNENCENKHRKQAIRQKAMRLLNRVQSQLYKNYANV